MLKLAEGRIYDSQLGNWQLSQTPVLYSLQHPLDVFYEMFWPRGPPKICALLEGFLSWTRRRCPRPPVLIAAARLWVGASLRDAQTQYGRAGTWDTREGHCFDERLGALPKNLRSNAILSVRERGVLLLTLLQGFLFLPEWKDLMENKSQLWKALY